MIEIDYTPSFYLRKFTQIPEEMWCSGAYQKGEAKCAAEHCGERRNSKESQMLAKLFRDNGLFLVEVNDGDPKEMKKLGVKSHNLMGPKDRVIHALKWIKMKIEGKNE